MHATRRLLAPLLALVAALSAGAGAEPIGEREVPEALRPWIPWVLRGQEDALCPALHGVLDVRACAWPARLALEVDDSGGRFAEDWRVDRALLVPLPGDDRRWPQAVTVDEKPAAVVAQDGLPHVRLERGVHRIAGVFVWRELPTLLTVSPEIGLLQLRVRGAAVSTPGRDAGGRLWLAARSGGLDEPARLDLEVSRLVVDEAPLRVVSRFALDVAGPSREVRLVPGVLDGFVPLALESVLPARIDADGDLVVQVRPGRWLLTLEARRNAPAPSVALPAAPAHEEATDARDTQETWAFEARSDLRLVELQGVEAVDPTQTPLPPEWRALPTFRVEPGQALQLVEKRRGDSDPAPDRLSLARALWLDFDGGGWTVQDNVSGRLSRSWRLEMGPETTLGRVAEGGVEQLVTRLPGGDGAAGVELRHVELALSADSRIEGARGRIPAVGWRQDFAEVSAVAELPPGWSLFHASGVDSAEPTWITRWSLLDLFLVLVSAFAVAQLFGRRWGLVALAALVLAWTEPGAPRWSWIVVLVVEALVRVLPAGRVRAGLRLARLAASVAVLVLLVPFLVQQVRAALHPSLAAPDVRVGGTLAAAHADAGMLERRLVRPAAPRAAAGAGSEKMDLALEAVAPEADRVESYSSGPASSAPARYAPDPNATVTTGPGLPDWTWERVELSWRGPVAQGQELRLWLVSPRVNFALAWLRVGLLSLLAVCLLRGLREPRLARPGGGPHPAGGPGGTAGSTLPAILCLALAGASTLAGDARAADFPPQPFLDELRQRLLEAPACAPSCAAASKLVLDVEGDALRLRFEVGAAAAVAAPLPGDAARWQPEQVTLDGQPASALRRDASGVLWIALEPGHHVVELVGRLPDRDAVELSLPLRPHRVEARALGWVVEGVADDGAPDDTLRLVRQGPLGGAPRDGSPLLLPPFARVERHLSLGLRFELRTRVERISPLGAPIVLAVPLLAGESVTSDGVRVENGHAMVTLAPNAAQLEWQSVLEPAPRIALRAPENVPWAELWTLDASPVWHVVAEGIPVVHESEQPFPAPRIRTFRPWPGEELALSLVRTEGVEGATLTLDRTLLTLSPGLRARDVTLEIALRSSRGGQHDVTLPEGAQLQSASIDGAIQPLRQEGREVTLPLHPGTQTAQLVWRESVPLSARLVSSVVDVGAPSVNASLAIEMPTDRWTLWLAGPRLGPAILFWSLLVVVALVAAGLGRLRATPLRARHWFLLGIGMTQAPVPASALVVGWLLALGWRRERGASLSNPAFRVVQIALVLATLAALASLFVAIQQGLLGLPEMQIRGNGSDAQHLHWYQDRAAALLPQASVLSVPLWAYRATMLAWALWIAIALVRWLRWGWDAFSEGGLWRALPRRPTRPAAGPPTSSPTLQS